MQNGWLWGLGFGFGRRFIILFVYWSLMISLSVLSAHTLVSWVSK